MIIIAILDSGGGIDIFTSGSSYLIVIGGTFAATFVNFPFKVANFTKNHRGVKLYFFGFTAFGGLKL